MKYVNFIALNADDSEDQETAAIDCSQLVSASFHCFFNDATAEGDIKIQASNDLCPVGYQPAQFTPTNWVDIPNATVSITSGGAALITLPQISYRWMRAVYNNDSGGSSEIIIEFFAISI